MYELLDGVIAEILGVETEIYIEKIEKTSLKRCEIIINAILSENKLKIEQAKRVFNLIN